MTNHLAALFLAVSLLGPSIAVADDAAVDPEDAKVLKEAGLTLDNKALLGFLHARPLAESDRTRILALVRKQGDLDFEVREKASEEIESLGAPAVPLLRQALHDEDVEIIHRSDKCLKQGLAEE